MKGLERKTSPGEFIGVDTTVAPIEHQRETGEKEMLVVIERTYHYRKRFTVDRHPDFLCADDIRHYKDGQLKASVRRGDHAEKQNSFRNALQEIVDAMRQARLMAGGTEGAGNG